jgi:hypothetical protein
MTTYQTICAVMLLSSFFIGLPALIVVDIYLRRKHS